MRIFNRRMALRINIKFYLSLIICLTIPLPLWGLEAGTIVAKCFNYMRGEASVSQINMMIHRPSWERRISLKAWTKGEKKSLFIITKPAKDKGNGTLKKGPEMWIFNPKIKRVIKLPPSMMSQAWNGSDFSNNDLAKTDSLLHDYVHQLIGVKSDHKFEYYIIDSIPKPDAPVVWGKLQLHIRKDFILLRQAYFDEDFHLVKELTTDKIEKIGDKNYPKIWRMEKKDRTGEYTKLEYTKLHFQSDLPDHYFTLSNLKNPRR